MRSIAVRFPARVAAIALGAFALAGPVTTTIAAGDPLNGRVLARQCSVCHGKAGIANDPEVANLAGQSAFYLQKSLEDYRSGARHDRRMTLIAQGLDEAAIDDLAAWYASIEVVATLPE